MLNWLRLPHKAVKNSINGEYLLTLSDMKCEVPYSFVEVEETDINLL